MATFHDQNADEKEILAKWTAEQNRLSQMLIVDDGTLGFLLPEYTPNASVSTPSASAANGMEGKSDEIGTLIKSQDCNDAQLSPNKTNLKETTVDISAVVDNNGSAKAKVNGTAGGTVGGGKKKKSEGTDDSLVGASSSNRPHIPSLHSSVKPCVVPLPSLESLTSSGNSPVGTKHANSTSPLPSVSSSSPLADLKVVAGIDISFVKDTDVAVASLVLLSYPDLKVIYTLMRHVTMKEPYIPGFLAFREVPLVAPLIEEARKSLPKEMHPQLLFVDGNGVHHPRRFGFASHLGVVCDIPTIGCAKKLLAVEGLVNSKISEDLEKWTVIDKKGPIMPLISPISNKLYGYAALTGNSTKNPVYISPGHRVGFTTALIMTILVTIFRVPEPIRQADLLSREYIRKNFSASGELLSPSRSSQ